MYDFGSPDTGSNGVQNGVFREFLEKYALDFNDCRAGRVFYNTSYVCKVLDSAKIWFMRYGVKRGPK